MKPDESSDGTILTRIFISESGDLVVTDLWEEVEHLLTGSNGSGFEVVHSNL
jgi:hypothetical protein